MKFYEYLIERQLLSEITFGFELEAFTDNVYFEKDIRDFFEGTFKRDSSIRPNNRNEEAFEFASAPMKFNPVNILNLKKFLKELPKIGVETNSSCGFHMHFSWPKIDEADIFWILINLSLDDKMKNKVEYFKKHHFFDREYANSNFLDKIKEIILRGNKDYYDELYNHLNEEKYRSFRIHPQGTLEWRGPRDFLNEKNINDIDDFIKLVYEFLIWVNKTLDIKQIKWVERAKIKKENVIVFDEKFKKIQKNAKYKKMQELIKKLNIKKYKIENDKLVILDKITWSKEYGDWKYGTWPGGIWKSGDWEDGIWKDGKWEGGFWTYGRWEKGIWENGFWDDGRWFNGRWFNGRWANGTWIDGTWESGIWRSGRWYNGTWKYGKWKSGIWENGTWKNGNWMYGIWENGIWEDGIWFNGTWRDGLWKDGTWKDGIWFNGTWRDGLWKDGTWKDGEWQLGKIYSKKFKTEIFSYNYNPKEFYEIEAESNTLKELKNKVNGN